MSGHSVTLVRRIAARPAIVWDLIATAEGLGDWFGPDDAPVLLSEADVRVGGAFRVRFATADGGEHECAGEYRTVEPPRRLVMSWRWTEGGEPGESGVSQLALDVRAIDTGAELTLTHSGLGTEASAEGHRGGWSGALDKLARQAEGRRA